MPTADATFECRGSVPAVRSLLVDPTFLASTIPGVTQVEPLGPNAANWHLEIRQGPISRKTVLRGEYRSEPDGSVRFSAEGAEVSLQGHVVLTPGADSTTRVQLSLEYEGKGPLKYIINNILKKALVDYPAAMKTSLESRLGAAGGRPPG